MKWAPPALRNRSARSNLAPQKSLLNSLKHCSTSDLLEKLRGFRKNSLQNTWHLSANFTRLECQLWWEQTRRFPATASIAKSNFIRWQDLLRWRQFKPLRLFPHAQWEWTKSWGRSNPENALI